MIYDTIHTKGIRYRWSSSRGGDGVDGDVGCGGGGAGVASTSY